MMNSSQEITFITSHPKKAAELGWHLHREILHQALELTEIQSLDPHEIVSHKAQQAFDELRKPVLVEDFSLRFVALGNLPGPLIKWFLEELKPDGLCKLLDSYDSRKAYVQDCFAYFDGKEIRIFDGTLEGVIARQPKGEYGYGTDCIFIPKGWTMTWGEMSIEEQIASSVRSIGLKKLEKFLKSLDV